MDDQILLVGSSCSNRFIIHQGYLRRKCRDLGTRGEQKLESEGGKEERKKVEKDQRRKEKMIKRRKEERRKKGRRKEVRKERMKGERRR
jgi:hypothetical protein